MLTRLLDEKGQAFWMECSEVTCIAPAEQEGFSVLACKGESFPTTVKGSPDEVRQMLRADGDKTASAQAEARAQRLRGLLYEVYHTRFERDGEQMLVRVPRQTWDRIVEEFHRGGAPGAASSLESFPPETIFSREKP